MGLGFTSAVYVLQQSCLFYRLVDFLDRKAQNEQFGMALLEWH